MNKNSDYKSGLKLSKCDHLLYLLTLGIVTKLEHQTGSNDVALTAQAALPVQF